MILKIENLTKKYGDKTAVSGLSFDVFPGEIFGLLGPNGAGKTTTLKVAVGLMAAGEGRVLLGEDEVKPGSPVLHEIGYFADEPFVYDKLTGREVLQIAGVLLNLERRALNARIESLAEQLQVTKILDQLTETYSRGNRRKIGLLTALLADPPVLVLDEPSESLDPIALKELISILEAARRQSRIILLSTHHLAMAQGLCDRVGLLNEGRLLFRGSLEQARLSYSLPQGSLEEIFMKAVRRNPNQPELISSR